MIIISPEYVVNFSSGAIYVTEFSIIYAGSAGRMILGHYDTEERANEVYRQLVERLKFGNDGYFEMPKE
jgi:hypothetical protein